jgi:rhodanese-related sulfurtransferase
MDAIIIDVREKDEYLAECIPGSIHLPLSDMPTHATALFNALRDKEILLMCRSGGRAQLALENLKCLNLAPLLKSLKVFEGGILEWKKQGRPVKTIKAAQLPILRQVHLIAGSVVLTSSLLALFVHQAWLFLAAAFGLGLTIAGATGFCGLGLLLSKMPWNRNASPAASGSCTTGCCSTER